MADKTGSLPPTKESRRFARMIGSACAAGAGGRANQGNSHGDAFSRAQSIHGNQAVLRMLNRSSGALLLQRKCACEGSGADCDSCAEKKDGMLHRSTASHGEPNAVPPIVHEVLRSPGQPLDAKTRAFMEPRFGYDFSGVRVYTDSRAAESARAVNALAYAVGSRVVFDHGRYQPTGADGRRLLAHELAHVVQSDRQSLQSHLAIGAATDSAERDADRIATAVISGQARVGSAQRPGGLIQRERNPSTPQGGGTGPTDAGAPGGTPGGPAAVPTGGVTPGPKPSFVCGPNVTKQVRNVVAALRSAYAGWNSTQREEACWALEDLGCGPVAWDVVELHNNAWIYQDYRPACASAGASPLCGSSVQVGTDCHNAGSVNYVIFGAMCDLCDMWRKTMHLMIWGHKVHLSGMDPDYGAALQWADAGFDGWPGTTTPAGDRTNCTATCPTAYAPTANNKSTAFDFHWAPPHVREEIGASCETSIDTHRNPPDLSPYDVGL